MGRVHNSPMPDQPTAESSEVTPTPNKLAGETYLTEDELAEKTKQELKDHQPFFTWIDEQGQLRSKLIPQIDASQTGIQPDEITDHTLLELYRFPHYETADCCAQFSARFKTRLVDNKSVLFGLPQFAKNFPTKTGAVSAWYFTAPPKIAARDPRLSIKLRGAEQPLALVALSKDFKLLHLLPKLLYKDYPETWRSLPYRESLIAISDPAVAAFILYFPQPAPDSANIEVQWQP